MSRLCLLAGTSILTLCFVGAAIAADLPAKASPIPVAVSNWTGFYLGVHGGYGWSDNPFRAPALNNSATYGGIDARGGLIGGHAGYNWQYGRIIAGLEVDVTATDIEGSTSVTLTDSGVATDTRQDRVAYLGSARARVGFLPSDSLLLYGTGGPAWERLKQTFLHTEVSGGSSFSATETNPIDRFGWVAGVGAEARLLGSNWLGRVEYLHYDFDRFSTSHFSASDGGQEHSTSGRQTVDVVRAALSYQFGPAPGSPVTAMAAALPVRAAPAALWSWSGFYLGVHGGYGWKDSPFTEPLCCTGDAAFHGIDSRGWLVGGHAGHNWQYGRVVAGLELDFTATGIKGSTSATINEGTQTETRTRQDRVKYLASARARLGFLPSDSLLLYGTAGPAWERSEQTNLSTRIEPGFSSTSTSTDPFDRFGWVAGVGTEARLLGSSWIGRVEYLHYDLGRLATLQSINTLNGAVVSTNRTTAGSQTIDVVRAGLSYKFGPSSDPGVTAMAAALPVKAAPAAVWAWSGFYLGVHGGYGWYDNPFNTGYCCSGDALVRVGGIDGRGWLVGGHAGHNWQFGRVIAGLEIDFTATGFKGSTSATLSEPDEVRTVTLEDRVKYLASARARLGFLPTDSVQLYGTAGLAWERLEAAEASTSVRMDGTDVESFVLTSTNPFNRFGWVAGAGAEARLFGSNWLGRVEYLHYDFGSFRTEAEVENGVSDRDTSGRQTIDVVRAGLSYKFGPN